jgi:hypothetical protein
MRGPWGYISEGKWISQGSWNERGSKKGLIRASRGSRPRDVVLRAGISPRARVLIMVERGTLNVEDLLRNTVT